MEYIKTSRVVHLAQGVQNRTTQQDTMLSVWYHKKTLRKNNKMKATP